MIIVHGSIPIRPERRERALELARQMTEATRTEEDAFERLLQASSRYDVALSQSSVDCSEARELVERICYLAERVCAQPGVAARDDDAEAHCDEGRARCTRSEARLRSACP